MSQAAACFAACCSASSPRRGRIGWNASFGYRRTGAEPAVHSSGYANDDHRISRAVASLRLPNRVSEVRVLPRAPTTGFRATEPYLRAPHGPGRDGHVWSRFSGHISIYGETLDALETACAQVVSEAQQAGLELRRMVGRQADALAETLPGFARGVAR